ncbi:MAG: S-layer homology domain-containing protein [Synergistaceae bacterium]|jgi:opacity protein-like surface antigen|nr:S-layer homology domain-containing protein [Synergistaceae bacterium]
MKKYLVAITVVVLATVAAPAFAAINPFMDVPLNHWSYDAIGQLAARGVLSGYPDGTYKGRQPTTRYEMSSALARSLALVDMTKATKQDVETLKRLVVEFKDELDALGVRADQLDIRLDVIESRLNGWRISGVMRLDIDDQDDNDDKDGRASLTRARLIFERWFGEDESLKFTGRINVNGDGIRYELFNVEMPAYWDSTLTVGRFVWDSEAAYYMNGNDLLNVPWLGNDGYLTDRYVDGLGVRKSFGLGKFSAYLARPQSGTLGGQDEHPWSMWEAFAMGEVQFTERFGFDLGVQYFGGDDSTAKRNSIDPATQKSWVDADGVAVKEGDQPGYRVNSIFTVFGGLRFDFSENIALKGIYYHQDANVDTSGVALDDTLYIGDKGWHDAQWDSKSAYKIILDINQDLLKFTSLWLEYDQLDGYFVMPKGNNLWGGYSGAPSTTWNGQDPRNTAFTLAGLPLPGNIVRADTTIWKIGAQQKWNDKWTTALYFGNHEWEATTNPSATQFDVGVKYQYTPNVAFGLAYSMFDYDKAATDMGAKDENVIHFRSEITF